MTSHWDRARAIADAVLYEGYLLYPYRANSTKNQCRWQFGVLGPPGAAESGLGEEHELSTQFLIRYALGCPTTLTMAVRFLQHQHRQAETATGNSKFVAVDELITSEGPHLTWDEAVEHEIFLDPICLGHKGSEQTWTIPLNASATLSTEEYDTGRLVRTRYPLHAQLVVNTTPTAIGAHPEEYCLMSVSITNTGAPAADKEDALARSFIGTHIIAHIDGGHFISLLEPPEHARSAIAQCTHHRCFPVLTGQSGDDDLLLISPIILYDYPEIAAQSAGALYDSTEIDEILTLRVLTMTDQEKAQARATDPLAAHIIERCETMSPQQMQQLHGVLRQPHHHNDKYSPNAPDTAETTNPRLLPDIPDGINWWDPLADNDVQPEIDAIIINGIAVSRGSQVILHPARRADAQDIFIAGHQARVTSVHADVDGNTHVAVVVDDDPAADMHEWYGRYLYFAPDEIEPLDTNTDPGITQLNPETQLKNHLTAQERISPWTP